MNSHLPTARSLPLQTGSFWSCLRKHAKFTRNLQENRTVGANLLSSLPASVLLTPISEEGYLMKHLFSTISLVALSLFVPLSALGDVLDNTAEWDGTSFVSPF